MTWDEYRQRVKPGMKVFVMHHGIKLSGVAGNRIYPDGKTEPVVQFDNGTTVYVKENYVSLFQLEPVN